MERQLIGQNIEAGISGRTLTLTVNLDADGRPSASGKSIVIASTHGNVALPEGVKVGVNVYRKA